MTVQISRNRGLDGVYPIVWLDAIHYKVMDDKNRPVSRAIYNVLGLCADGRKELQGMYIAKSGGANFSKSYKHPCNFSQIRGVVGELFPDNLAVVKSPFNYYILAVYLSVEIIFYAF